MNVIIGIGYGASSTRPALSEDEQKDFRNAVIMVTETIGKFISVIDGESYSRGWGQEDATWIVAEIQPTDLILLYSELERLRMRFEQDAIAVTVGHTQLIGV